VICGRTFCYIWCAGLSGDSKKWGNPASTRTHRGGNPPTETEAGGFLSRSVWRCDPRREIPVRQANRGVRVLRVFHDRPFASLPVPKSFLHRNFASGKTAVRCETRGPVFMDNRCRWGLEATEETDLEALSQLPFRIPWRANSCNFRRWANSLIMLLFDVSDVAAALQNAGFPDLGMARASASETGSLIRPFHREFPPAVDSLPHTGRGAFPSREYFQSYRLIATQEKYLGLACKRCGMRVTTCLLFAFSEP